MLNAKEIPSSGGKRQREPGLEAGGYPARLVQIIDLGVQKQMPYKGKEKDPKPELYTTHELLDEFITDDDGNLLEDKPRWVSERFAMHSLDSDLAKSTKRYVALDPELKYGGDWAKLIGAPSIVTLVQGKVKDEKDKFGNPYFPNYISLVNTMRAKDAQKAPELKNEPKVFDFDNPDLEVFNSLPNWLQETIKEALNYPGSKLEKALGGGSVDSGVKEEQGPNNNEESDW